MYDAAAAPSPLSLPGAVDHCVELFSFAKSYHLGGFRLGYILGNADVISSLEAVKVWCTTCAFLLPSERCRNPSCLMLLCSVAADLFHDNLHIVPCKGASPMCNPVELLSPCAQATILLLQTFASYMIVRQLRTLPCITLQAPIDFNQYLGIQRMGVACLQLPVQRVRDYAAVWQRRAAALVPVLRQHGWHIPEPKACENSVRLATCREIFSSTCAVSTDDAGALNHKCTLYLAIRQWAAQTLPSWHAEVTGVH